MYLLSGFSLNRTDNKILLRPKISFPSFFFFLIGEKLAQRLQVTKVAGILVFNLMDPFFNPS